MKGFLWGPDEFQETFMTRASIIKIGPLFIKLICDVWTVASVPWHAIAQIWVGRTSTDWML